MKMLTLTPALRQTALNCVWYKSPEAAIRDTADFAAHVLTYGDPIDIEVLRRQLDDDDLRAVLDEAPPGVFDSRSWAYWNLMAGRNEAPPMPERTLP